MSGLTVIEQISHHDVEGIRVGRFGSRINTTCIVYRLGATVIDTGPPNQWRTVRRFLEEREVRKVLVTHHHEDHSGNLAPIRKLLSPEIYAAPEALEPLAKGFRLRPYQKLIWGKPTKVSALAIPREIPVAGGQTLRALPTPGHSTDMTCYLHVERGWLFTGDLFISQKIRHMRADENLQSMIASLHRVLDLEFDTILCSHRGVVPDGKRAIRAKLDAIESLCVQVRRLRDEGRGRNEITRTLLGREGSLSWITGLHFSKRNLIQGCLDVVSRSYST
jgi:glyoxylase-like metal-dependent hydrolase (beta-lactamase superfamily II)